MNHDDPAFPTFAEINNREVVGTNGLTLRHYFAGQALIGVLSTGALAPTKDAVDVAVDLADALIARLAKRP